MATFNAEQIKPLTGDPNKDIREMHETLTKLINDLNYILNNIDDENITDELKKMIKE